MKAPAGVHREHPEDLAGTRLDAPRSTVPSSVAIEKPPKQRMTSDGSASCSDAGSKPGTARPVSSAVERASARYSAAPLPPSSESAR